MRPLPYFFTVPWRRIRVELQLANIQLGPGLIFGSNSLREQWCLVPMQETMSTVLSVIRDLALNEMSNGGEFYFTVWSNSSQMLWIRDWDRRIQVLLWMSLALEISLSVPCYELTRWGAWVLSRFFGSL